MKTAKVSGSLSEPLLEKVSLAISHLRCYIDFAEEDIMPRYQFLRIVGHLELLRVRFQELWYLFRHGDLIFTPDKTLKGHVVDKIERHLKHLARNLKDSTMHQSIWRLVGSSVPLADPVVTIDSQTRNDGFSISLYCLDYDGLAYSPVRLSFAIPYFEGDRDVVDFTFFPLRFAKGHLELLEENHKVGSMFTQCLR